VPVHVKIHTGMSRYGVRWDEALPLIEQIVAEKSLLLEGVMTHFAQSDETDKTFANLQFRASTKSCARWNSGKFP
jgi:alanine racemase